MVVAGEQDSVRNRIEDSIEFPVLIGRAFKIPQVLQLLGIQPRLDMAEVATPFLQSWLERCHELQRLSRVSRSTFIGGLETQAEVVISPDADRVRVGQQMAGFVEHSALTEDITNHDNLFDLFAPQLVECSPKVFHVLVNVGQESKLH